MPLSPNHPSVHLVKLIPGQLPKVMQGNVTMCVCLCEGVTINSLKFLCTWQKLETCKFFIYYTTVAVLLVYFTTAFNFSAV